MALWNRMFSGVASGGPDWIEVNALSAALEADTAPLVIDVRGPDEFSGPLGHIKDARNVPLDQVLAQAAGLTQEARPLVLVCHTDRRSAAAAKMLRDAGASQVAVLRGGMVAWRQHGL